jgi:hypothetical protein
VTATPARLGLAAAFETAAGLASMLQAPVSSISNISEVCCKCFHTDVAKVDQDVAHVAMVVHVCCKLLFSMFHLFFLAYVASVFIWILHMFSYI